MPNYRIQIEIDERSIKTLLFVIEADDEEQAVEAMEAWAQDDPAGMSQDADTIDAEVEVTDIFVQGETNAPAYAVASAWL